MTAFENAVTCSILWKMVENSVVSPKSEKPEKPVWSVLAACHKDSEEFSSGKETAISPTYTAGARKEGEKRPRDGYRTGLHLFA